MGIKYLNKYLLKKCGKNSIYDIHLKHLKNKTIVIDTYIYLYKLSENGDLSKNMSKFIQMFLKNNITPIFIFDGKPPIEKEQTLLERKKNKKEAENKYNQLMSLSSMDEKGCFNNNVSLELQHLKKQFIRIHKEDIKNVKSVMDDYNVAYIDAPNEADSLCVYMVKKNVAWACLSDDMDMFVYGCNRVIRNLDISTESAVLYNLNNILFDLKCNMKEFREILVLSGTDYNSNPNNAFSLTDVLKIFHDYKKTKIQENFYHWLMSNTNYIDNFEHLMKTYNLFIVDNYNTLYKKYILPF